jgi:preprotein translocase subunit SecF
MRFFVNTNYDFMKYRRVWAVVSTVLSVLALVVVFAREKLNVGIDFAGGTQVVVRFHQAPDLERLRRALAASGLGDASIQSFGGADSGEVMIRTPLRPDQEEGRASEILAALDRSFNADRATGAGSFDLNQRGTEDLADLLLDADPLQLRVSDEEAALLHYQQLAEAVLRLRREHGVLSGWEALSALPEMTPEVVSALQQRAYFGNFGLLGQEVVGPTVGAELRQRGVLAVVLSVLAMLVYIWVRFELRFGIGAVIAVIHDVLVVLGLYALSGLEFNLTTVAAFLTLIGYSVNDSVVVFDRVREQMRKGRRGRTFYQLINESMNQTLSRTILTGSSTLACTTALLFLGGEVLRGFSFVLTVGVLVGTYSSIWVATSFTLLWEEMVARRRTANGREVSSARAGGSKEGKLSAGSRRG